MSPSTTEVGRASSELKLAKTTTRPVVQSVQYYVRWLLQLSLAVDAVAVTMFPKKLGSKKFELLLHQDMSGPEAASDSHLQRWLETNLDAMYVQFLPKISLADLSFSLAATPNPLFSQNMSSRS